MRVKQKQSLSSPILPFLKPQARATLFVAADLNPFPSVESQTLPGDYDDSVLHMTPRERFDFDMEGPLLSVNSVSNRRIDDTRIAFARQVFGDDLESCRSTLSPGVYRIKLKSSDAVVQMLVDMASSEKTFFERGAQSDSYFESEADLPDSPDVPVGKKVRNLSIGTAIRFDITKSLDKSKGDSPESMRRTVTEISSRIEQFMEARREVVEELEQRYRLASFKASEYTSDFEPFEFAPRLAEAAAPSAASRGLGR